MKGIIAVLTLALVLQTAFILSRLQGSTPGPTGSQPPTEYKALTTKVERLSTDVAELKARVSALEAGAATLTPTPVPVPYCVVNRERVNVREGPGVAFAVVGTVSRGEEFDIRGSNAAGDWYRFCCVDGKSGWIYAPLLICTDDKDIPTPPTNTPTPTKTPTPTNTPTPADTPTSEWPRIVPENSCSSYEKSDYSYPQSVESQIVRQLGGRIFSPYTGQCFSSTSETQIEHIVARSEAHDSGLCAASVATRQAFARDILNLTLASPSVNSQKAGKDAAEWLPTMNQCWFVNQVMAVKRKYGLSMDPAEWQKVQSVLNGCSSTAMQFTECPPPPPPPCPRNCTEAHEMGMSNMGTGHRCYKPSLDRDGDGIACER